MTRKKKIEYSEAKRKEMETRAALGPRLPRSKPIADRVYTELHRASKPSQRRTYLPRDTGG